MDETSITALEIEELEAIVRDMKKTAARDGLASLKPGDILPGGRLVIVPAKMLEAIEPFIDAIICYAYTITEHPPNGAAVELRAILANARLAAAKEDGDG